MASVNMIPEQKTTGKVKDIYEEIKQKIPGVLAFFAGVFLDK